MPTITKICSKCRAELPATSEYFHRDSTKPDGLYPSCKACKSAQGKQYFIENREAILAGNRAWQSANPDRHRELIRRWQKANPDKVKESARRTRKKHRDKANAQSLAYRWNNIDRLREYDREYSKKNRERKRADQARYRQADPDRYRAYVINYQSLKKNGGEKITADDIRRLYQSQDGRCFWCSVVVNNTFHVDHVIPLSRGGLHCLGNLVVTCPSCNESKNAKIAYDEWTPPNPLT